MDKFHSPKFRNVNVFPLVRTAVEHVTAGVRYTVTDGWDKFVYVLTLSSPTSGRQHDDVTRQQSVPNFRIDNTTTCTCSTNYQRYNDDIDDNDLNCDQLCHILNSHKLRIR